MPSRSQRTFGKEGLYQKKGKDDLRPKTASQKMSKEKRGRDSHHKKQKNDTSRSPTQQSDAIPNITIAGSNFTLQ